MSILMLVVLGVMLLAAVVTGIVLLALHLTKPGDELTRVAVRPGEPFVLLADITGYRAVSLWVEVDVRFEKLDLHGPIQLTVDEEPLRSLRFRLRPRGNTLEDSTSRIKRTWVSTPGHSRGSSRITKVEVDGSRLTAAGTIKAGRGVDLRQLDLVLSGSK